MWKPCYTSCNSCYKDFIANAHYCTDCIAGYYKIEGDTANDNCVNKPPIGFYFDPSALLYKKCYLTCATCDESGSESDNKCTTCKNGYYKFEDIEGKCDDTDTSPEGNYYLK